MKLHEYQKKAIQFCLDCKQTYLAIDLGMGKTAIALHVISQTKQKAFVFAPLRTIYTSWPDEIQKWTPHLKYRILHGPDKTLVGINDVDILLMNYESLKWFSQQNIKWQRRLVVYDEASMVKSHSTSRFKMLRKMYILWTEYKLCLSATPAPNALSELWSQYYLLDRGASLGQNITSFRKQFCTAFSYPGMAFTQYKVDPRHTQRIYDLIAPRTFRLEAGDYLEMPPITYNHIPCVLPPALKKKYDKLEKDFFLELEESEIEVPNAAQMSMKLRQFVQGGLYDEDKVWINIHNVKLSALKELLDTSCGTPILCAIQFRGELAMIRKEFPTVPVIAGGVPAKVSNRLINEWNAGKLPLLLCHPGSLSHGVNLQSGGHTLLWYGLTWSLEQYLQLNGRLYRQGQLNPVVIHHLVMKETIDEAVLNALASKDMGQTALLEYIKEYKHANLKKL